LKRENDFQSSIIKELKAEFPDCMVLKLDSGYIQGIPDLLVLYRDKWAVLECKRSENSPHRPNQDFYIERLDGMGFASFIFPENKDRVTAQLTRYFGL